MEIAIIFIWLICAALGYAVSGRPLGAILGLLLGPLGVLIAVFVKE